MQVERLSELIVYNTGSDICSLFIHIQMKSL